MKQVNRGQENIAVYTIGFTQKSAQYFFETLQRNGVQKIIDVRLNNSSQLAGFTKKHDLAYFSKIICGIQYEHRPEFSPTEELKNNFKNNRIAWSQYADEFRSLLEQRQIVNSLDISEFHQACLLCSEPEARNCHRRVAAEYLQEKWPNISITHL